MSEPIQSHVPLHEPPEGDSLMEHKFVTYPAMIGLMVTVVGASVFGLAWLVSPDIQRIAHQIERMDDRSVSAFESMNNRIGQSNEHYLKELNALKAKLEQDIRDVNAKLENGIRSRLDEAVKELHGRIEKVNDRIGKMELFMAANRRLIHQDGDGDPESDTYRQQTDPPEGN